MKRFAIFMALSAAVLLVAPLSHAAPQRFVFGLSGANEVPPNASTATGGGFVDIDPQAHTMRVSVTFSGLTSNTVMAHIHCCISPPGNAGVATTIPAFAGFPLGVTNGNLDATFNMTLASSWNPAYITANGGTTASAETALFNGIRNTTAYFNIHTTNFPPGEVRGFLVEGGPTNVPTLAEWGIFALAGIMLLIGFAIVHKRSV